jgi:hypothetical protein
VSVAARATVRTVSFPSEVKISAADIKRGYLEVRGATLLVAGKGARVGLVVDALPTAGILPQVAIRTMDAEQARGGADGSQIVGRRGSQDDPLLLYFLLKLPPGVTPGRYPWPLLVEVCLDY